MQFPISSTEGFLSRIGGRLPTGITVRVKRRVSANSDRWETIAYFNSVNVNTTIEGNASASVSQAILDEPLTLGDFIEIYYEDIPLFFGVVLQCRPTLQWGTRYTYEIAANGLLTFIAGGFYAGTGALLNTPEHIRISPQLAMNIENIEEFYTLLILNASLLKLAAHQPTLNQLRKVFENRRYIPYLVDYLAELRARTRILNYHIHLNWIYLDLIQQRSNALTPNARSLQEYLRTYLNRQFFEIYEQYGKVIIKTPFYNMTQGIPIITLDDIVAPLDWGGDLQAYRTVLRSTPGLGTTDHRTMDPLSLLYLDRWLGILWLSADEVRQTASQVLQNFSTFFSRGMMLPFDPYKMFCLTIRGIFQQDTTASFNVLLCTTEPPKDEYMPEEMEVSVDNMHVVASRNEMDEGLRFFTALLCTPGKISYTKEGEEWKVTSLPSKLPYIEETTNETTKETTVRITEKALPRKEIHIIGLQKTTSNDKVVYKKVAEKTVTARDVILAFITVLIMREMKVTKAEFTEGEKKYYLPIPFPLQVQKGKEEAQSLTLSDGRNAYDLFTDTTGGYPKLEVEEILAYEENLPPPPKVPNTPQNAKVISRVREIYDAVFEAKSLLLRALVTLLAGVTLTKLHKHVGWDIYAFDLNMALASQWRNTLQTDIQLIPKRKNFLWLGVPIYVPELKMYLYPISMSFSWQAASNISLRYTFSYVRPWMGLANAFYYMKDPAQKKGGVIKVKDPEQALKEFFTEADKEFSAFMIRKVLPPVRLTDENGYLWIGFYWKSHTTLYFEKAYKVYEAFISKVKDFLNGEAFTIEPLSRSCWSKD